MLPKFEVYCDKCGKKLLKNKYQISSCNLCRKCKMKETYSKKDLTETLKKRKETCFKKYGVANVAQNEKVKEKTKKTCLKKYGVTCSLALKEINDKGQKAAHSEESYEKRKKTCLKKYGTLHHMKNPEIVKKVFDSYKEKTGFNHPMENPEIKEKMIEEYGSIGRVRGYFYQNIHFDSSWELAYFLYLKHLQKNFIYHPKYTFEYMGDDGNTHVYHPDFLIEGIFYEIKGTQFFNDKGEPYNMYTKTFWWGKYNSLKENKVQILYLEDIKPALEYVKQNFGKSFLKSCKI